MIISRRLAIVVIRRIFFNVNFIFVVFAFIILFLFNSY